MANFPGKGTLLQVALSSTASYNTVSQVQNIEGPSAEMGTREITHLASFAREFAPTIVNGGTVTAGIIYDPTNAGQMMIQSAVHTTGVPTSLAWRVVFSTTTKFFAFEGVPTQFSISGITVDDTVMANVGIQVSGVTTLPTTT